MDLWYTGQDRYSLYVLNKNHEVAAVM